MSIKNKSAAEADNNISPIVTEDRISELESRIEDLEAQIAEVKDIAECAYPYADGESELGTEAYEIAWDSRVELNKLKFRIEELEEVIG